MAGTTTDINTLSNASYNTENEQKNFLGELKPDYGNAQQHLLTEKKKLNIEGFVLIFPTLDRVYWSDSAASLHGEDAAACTQFNLRQFMQWYQPNQRDLFAQSLFSEAKSQGFQIDLCVAHNNQHLRYLCIPLMYNEKVIWAGFIRVTIARKNATTIDFALQKARRLLAELE